MRFFDREKQWLDGLTTVDPDELPWRSSPQFTGTEYWSMWNWSGLESIPISDLKKNIVCMTPYQDHDFPECTYNRYSIMKKIGETNAENYKNLTGFIDDFNYLYATEKYYPATESYPITTRNANGSGRFGEQLGEF